MADYSLTIKISNAGNPATNHEKDQEHTTRGPALRCIDGLGYKISNENMRNMRLAYPN